MNCVLRKSGFLTRKRCSKARQPLFVMQSVAHPERRWLNAERAQVDVSLTAVMNFVVDGILNRRHSWVLPLAKRLVDFAESVRRNVRELRVQLCRLRIPQTEKLILCAGLRPLELL